MKRPRWAISLIEVLVTMFFLCSLVGIGFRLRTLWIRNLLVVQETNVALFALESLRNRILSDVMNARPFEPRQGAAYIADMRLPFPVTIEDTAATGSLSRRVLRLQLRTPDHFGLPGRIYTREVALP